MNPQIQTVDFNERPFIAIWEVTQACDLACVHCRASAQPERHPEELSTAEGKELIDQIASWKVPVFVLTYRSLRFTNASYLALFVFFVLHEIGAHYTYSEVPYDAWFTAYLGFSPNHYFALSRNDYDRFVHAMYGLLMTPVANELFANRAAPRGLWRWVFPVTFIMSHSLIYELVEWFAAVHFGGNLGAAYLGSQGDPWDAQRDMLLASMGSILSMGIIMASRAWSHRTRQATSDSTLR